MSASSTPDQALAIIARSSRRLGGKIPGVSMKINCESSTIAIPRSSARVVCALCETMATLAPTSALISVDLPTLGAPISATNPQRMCGFAPGAGMPLPPSRSGEAAAGREPFVSEAISFDTSAREHSGSGGLLRGPLGATQPLGRRQMGKLHRDAEFRTVVRALALDLTIGRRWHSARLRPFLQHRLRIAQRPRRRAHAFAPEPFDERCSGGISAVDEHCPDQRLANVRQDCRAAPASGMGFRRTKPDPRAEIYRPADIRAGLPAH